MGATLAFLEVSIPRDDDLGSSHVLTKMVPFLPEGDESRLPRLRAVPGIVIELPAGMAVKASNFRDSQRRQRLISRKYWGLAVASKMLTRRG